MPFVYSNQTGVYGGDDADERLILNPNGTTHGTARENITKKDWFFLSTGDPTLPTSNAKTLLIQYKGADKVTDTDPKVTLNVNGVDQDFQIKTTGLFTISLAGKEFNFVNDSTGTSNDFGFYLNGPDWSTGKANSSMSTYVRTYYNTLINITNMNATDTATEADPAGGRTFLGWKVNVSVDDGNRDGDSVVNAVNAGTQVFEMTISNSSATPWDATSTVTKGATWQQDNNENTIERFTGNYGYEIISTTPSSSPTSIEAKVPKNIVRPLVYFSTGDVSVSTTTGDTATSLGDVLVMDSEVNSVSSKNLIVVGGSCINAAAAKLLGDNPACEADFTTATGIGSGQFLIKGYATSSITSKIALLVAGYETVDTMNAVTYLRTQSPDTDKEYKGTNGQTATMVTEEVAA